MPNEIYHRSEWGNPKAEGFGDVYFDASATNKLYKHSDNYENSDGTDKILRDIPNKASIVLTPTAYSDGSLNTVIPPYQVLPQELVTNGTFDTDLSGWSVLNEDATHTVTYTADGARYQSDTTSPILFFKTIDSILESGKKYSITVEIVNLNSGSVKISGAGIDLFYNSEGVFTNIIQPTSNTAVVFYRNSANVDLTIKSVSVKEIQEADFDFSRGSSATRVNEKGLIEDVASNIPRIDYTSGQGALLLEPQRTNLIPYSEDFSGWDKTGLTVSSNQIISPDGSLNADEINISAANAHYLFNTISVSASTNYTFTFYVKKGTATDVSYSILNATNFTNIVNTTSYFNEISNTDWTRITVGFTTPAGCTSVRTYPLRDGSSTGTVYIWGAQLEQGSYATSYIVSNSGSATTRSADVANNSGNADLFNDSEGVLYANIQQLQTSSGSYLSISNGSTGERLIIGSESNFLRVYTDVNVDGSVQPANTDFNKIAVKYNSSNTSIYYNGFLIKSINQSPNLSGINELKFTSGGSTQNLYGNTKELAVFKEALTDAELESLTSWISFVEMATDLEYTIE